MKESDRTLAQQNVLKSHLNKHLKDLKEYNNTQNELVSKLKFSIGNTLSKLLIKNINNIQQKDRISSLRTKNKKIHNLLQLKNKNIFSKYSVPVINLSSYELSSTELKQLKLGLHHSFIDRNKHIKKNLAANLESVAQRTLNDVNHTQLEDFHEFLRGYTDIFTRNILDTKDYTYHLLKNMINNKDIVVLSGDKDSSIVIMNRNDYVKKFDEMLADGVRNGIYESTTDTTFSDLSKFQSFLYRNFRDYQYYDKMRPQSNQPARLFGTAKTHKFESTRDITKHNIKFRPIIDQTGFYTYNASQVISEYLKPLCKNEFTINDTQQFPRDLSNLPPLEKDEEDVSYDVESLFTNIPVSETIDYIINQIYVHKKLKPICNKLIFRRLLIKLSTECKFTFDNKFYKQIDGCTMGGPLSVTFSDIFMVKMENEIVSPLRPMFYRRYVDDIFNRRKKDSEDILFNNLNNYHRKIKMTIEIQPSKFLDTKLNCVNGIYETMVYRKENKLPPHWSSKIPKRYKRNAIIGDLHRAKRISSNFNTEVYNIKTKFQKAGYPFRFVNSIVNQFSSTYEAEDSFIIPPNFFEDEKPFILIEIPFCDLNERKSKDFVRKFHKFTDGKYRVSIKWITKKVKNFFPLKDKVIHPSCKIYRGVCSCNKDYIGETIRNTEKRWQEHENPSGNSEPSNHLRDNFEHKFNWSVIANAAKNKWKRKNLEANYIALLRPSLNEQVNFNKLILFRNGIT